MQGILSRSFFISLAFVFCVSLSYGQAAPTGVQLRPIQKNGKWGYIDREGKIVIQPQFEWAEEFSESLAAFESTNGKHGYIDQTGRIVIQPIFDNWTNFSEGLAAVSVDLSWGYIDKSGHWAIPAQFAEARPFSDGLARVALPISGKPTFPPGPETHGFIDRTGAFVIKGEKEILNGRFDGGVGVVQYVDNRGLESVLIDKRGRVLMIAEQLDIDFSEGLVPARQNEKWGFVDRTGKFVIAPRFEEARAFSEGLAAVHDGKAWGFIDHRATFVIPPKFGIGPEGEADGFSEGLMPVYLKNDCAYLDRTGKIVFRLRCDQVHPFVGGLASVHIQHGEIEKRGYVNRQGKFVWGPEIFKYKSLEEIRSRAQKEAQAEEILEPLTDEERTLNPRQLILNQPDFVGDLTYFVSEVVSGHGGAVRIARKGNRYRLESPYWLFVGELGKPAARVFPAAKTYDAFEAPRMGNADSEPLEPQALAGEPDTTFEMMGKVNIDGHKCIKIQVKRKDEKIYLYAARDLKNLVIAAQVIKTGRTMGQKLANISLDVPDSLVEIPADYKPVEHDRWTKLENVTLTYNGKPSRDFGVFRSPSGDFFVWINDARYPWHYLIRSKEAIRETAFQGLLVTRTGEYVWRTNDKEAFSLTHYRIRRPSKFDNENEMRVIVGPNSLRFRSIDFDKDRVMIEIKWKD